MQQTRRAWELWRLFLDKGDSAIEGAAGRAHEFLFMEWRYNMLLPRGTLAIPLDDAYVGEWEEFMDLSRLWHTGSKWAKRRLRKDFEAAWRQPPKTIEQIIYDFPENHGMNLD
ncbi:hypothetical protein [Occultella gossypii]|uniref:Uncharacterized protein n=1 Tax=Occultella gossypii TaxID=2800820 RepID=A0ABS7S4X7_9MICO|nr:hypothetical protein [Occultella gossypii]MBZ2195394.1 hypothetical protein [Occultella gossypii]